MLNWCSCMLLTDSGSYSDQLNYCKSKTIPLARCTNQTFWEAFCATNEVGKTMLKLWKCLPTDMIYHDLFTNRATDSNLTKCTHPRIHFLQSFNPQCNHCGLQSCRLECLYITWFSIKQNWSIQRTQQIHHRASASRSLCDFYIYP